MAIDDTSSKQASVSEPTETDDAHVIHDHPVPPEELWRYSPVRDAASEEDIARYVEIEARDEKVSHVERIKTEYIISDPYEIWDVNTDKNRWWVITNMTNLYSQKHFPSLDYTLSFHVGLMMRLRSRNSGPDAEEPGPFDDVLRRQEQIHTGLERAIEAEAFQAIGMQLREMLIALVTAMRRQVALPIDAESPQSSNFKAWSELLISKLCSGGSNEELRKFIRTSADSLWGYVNWLTHARNADARAATVTVHAADVLVGHFFHLTERNAGAMVEKCPVCSSRNIRTHFDREIGEHGAYFHTCGSCSWHDHPEGEEEEG